jgi:hypothetical protein
MAACSSRASESSLPVLDPARRCSRASKTCRNSRRRSMAPIANSRR